MGCHNWAHVLIGYDWVNYFVAGSATRESTVQKKIKRNANANSD